MINSRIVSAIVPIKEHSERIRGKNFKNFLGKPLYHSILNTLEKTNEVDQIIVDTDSVLVQNEAPSLFPKVKIIERSKYLRGDFVSVNKIIEYDISIVNSDIYIQTHSTNPLLKAKTIANALKIFVELDENCDSIFSVTKYLSRFYLRDGKAINHNPNDLIRTQDLDPVYEENSVIYIFTKESFSKRKHRIGANPMLYEIPFIESIDIDTEFDFKLAEIIASANNLK